MTFVGLKLPFSIDTITTLNPFIICTELLCGYSPAGQDVFEDSQLNSYIGVNYNEQVLHVSAHPPWVKYKRSASAVSVWKLAARLQTHTRRTNKDVQHSGQNTRRTI